MGHVHSPLSSGAWAVVHEDICFNKGVDAHAAKMDLKHAVEDMGGKLPAEHGHGTEYVAPAETRERWQAMDPLNVFNPGVGGLSVARKYGQDATLTATNANTLSSGHKQPLVLLPNTAKTLR